MPNPPLITFEEALEDARSYGAQPNLLLGNGFSIACRPDRFSYRALLDEASFDAAEGDIRGVFDLLGTSDFERVIEELRAAASLVERYGTQNSDLADRLRHDSEVLRDALAETLAAKHPDLPSDINNSEYAAVCAFLARFDRIYTLNYDMLLYWAVMQQRDTVPPPNDGFTAPAEAEADYVVWEPYMDFRAQRLFFLHGGLHLYDRGSELSKITWSRTGVPLVDQIRAALDDRRYPLIVTEGTSDEKESKILHSAYLTHGLRSFASTMKPLFVFGHSLAGSDNHVLQRLVEGKVSRLYVSLYGERSSDANRAVVGRADSMAAARPASRPLTVLFYDAASAVIWG